MQQRNRRQKNAFAARSTRANRPRRALSRNSIPWMPNAKVRKRTSRASSMKDGNVCPIDTTMGALPAAIWIDQRLSGLIADIAAGKVNCVIVYKVDRLSRSLLGGGRVIYLASP